VTLRSLLLVFAACVLPGCYLSHELGDDAGVRDLGTTDGEACMPTTGHPRPLDVLFVVDDSPSMAEEQAQLAVEIPRFVLGLVTGDGNGDGVRDFQPIEDMHVGVITVNMGVGGVANVPTCMRAPDFGDDGVLLTSPRLGGAGCLSSYPHFLTYAVGGDAMRFSADLSCLARTGASGCGDEQQLDATIKALLPSTSPVTFFSGTHGHGDDPATNGGFLRAGSVIAVLMLTDEDDCSTADPDIWNPASSVHSGDLNLRCINYDDQLYPTSRFVDALHSLRPTAPADLVLLAITGVPPDLVDISSSPTIDYTRLFADPRMQNHITTMGSVQTLDPACSSPGRGIAAPGVRITKVARGLGTSGLVQSICASDFNLSLAWLAARAGGRASCVTP